MIRPLTMVSLLLAAGAGLYLYQVKHRTLLLDRQIAATMRETEALRAKEGMLQAEWALLNQPDRLADLAARYLALKPLAPTQFVPLAELDRHLPAIALASATTEGSDDDAEAALATSATPTSPAAAVEAGIPETRPPAVASLAPTLPATLAPAHPATAHPALAHPAIAHPALAHPADLHPAAPATEASRSPKAASPVRIAVNAAGARPVAPVIAPQPVAVSVLRPVAATLLGAPSRAGRTPEAAAGSAPSAGSVPSAGSALGGLHAALPPPVPVSANRPEGQ